MIAALVPAAGASARMGRPKLLMEFAGQTLIGRVVSALCAGGASRVVVVVPPADTAEGRAIANAAVCSGAEVIVPLTRPVEMRDSIELGLETMARGACPRSVLLTPGDYPGITPEIVRQLVEYAVKMPECLIIPTYNGRRGHPIVLPWAIAVRVPSLPKGLGVNALVEACRDSIVELTVSDPGIIADLDTPADLDRWQRRQGSPARSPSDPTILDSGLPVPDAGQRGAGARFRVVVRLFALAKERAGRSELEIELESGSNVAALKAALIERWPELTSLVPTALIAVDEEYAGDEVPVGPGSRAAVIPPVSGGAGGSPRTQRGRSDSGGLFPR